MLKKMTVLAMAVGVVAALALPASASAAWQHNHKPLAENVELGLTGNVRFQGGLGGIECQITSTATFFAGQTTAVADTFVPDPGPNKDGTETNRCKGLGGLAFCQIHNLTPQVPNWTVHTEASQTTQATTVGGETHQSAAVVTTTTIHSQVTGGFCPVTTVSLTAGKVGIIPEPTGETTITDVTLHGVLKAHQTTSSGAVDSEDVVVSGTLQIEDPLKQKTYGF